jgi:hypothetical protein
VGASTADYDAFDWCVADAAGLAGAGVDVVMELEEAGYAVGIHVVGDGGAAQLDGFAQDFLQGFAEAGQFGAGETSGLAEGTDAGVEESFISVDVAYSVEKRLVEQGGFDGGFAIVEEGDEVFEGDGEGFFAGAGVGFGCDGEAAEAAGVYEAKFATAAEGEDGVGVGWYGCVWGGDEKASGHAKVDEELGGFFLAGEIDDDGLAYAMNAVDAAAGEDFNDLVGW